MRCRLIIYMYYTNLKNLSQETLNTHTHMKPHKYNAHKFHTNGRHAFGTRRNCEGRTRGYIARTGEGKKGWFSGTLLAEAHLFWVGEGAQVRCEF